MTNHIKNICSVIISELTNTLCLCVHITAHKNLEAEYNKISTASKTSTITSFEIQVIFPLKSKTSKNVIIIK